jgi:hypothetical protein
MMCSKWLESIRNEFHAPFSADLKELAALGPEIKKLEGEMARKEMVVAG